MQGKSVHFRLALLIAVVCISLSSLNHANVINKVFSQDKLQSLVNQYGKQIEPKMRSWQALIEDNFDRSDWHRLHEVNHFAHRNIEYADDIIQWQTKDYWATPVESLAHGKGDCEDYAIFKYMTLRAMGVTEDKLRLMYVRAIAVDTPHMVLIYFDEPKAIPLVLDNLNPRILPANRRSDLKPIYSFNGQGLWLARAHGLGKKVKSGSGVKNWDLLLDRIELGE